MDTKVLITNPAKCNGCKECQTACSMKHTGLETSEFSRIHVLEAGDGDFFLPVTCQHCENPSCLAVCPESAIYRDEALNRVMINQDLCVGCQLCVSACPIGAMAFHEGRGKAFKCDLCDGEPECVRACEPKAVDYVDAHRLHYPRLREAAGKLSGVGQKRAA
jgi:Fe-S-cluster-containing hydrogenase component 2